MLKGSLYVRYQMNEVNDSINRKRVWYELPSRIFADDASGKDLEAKLMRHAL